MNDMIARSAISFKSALRAFPEKRNGNILEVAHQRAFSPLSIKSTEVNFIIETRNAAHANEVVTALRAAGFEVRTLDSASAGAF
jgi:threonine dehydratase